MLLRHRAAPHLEFRGRAILGNAQAADALPAVPQRLHARAARLHARQPVHIVGLKGEGGGGGGDRERLSLVGSARDIHHANGCCVHAWGVAKPMTGRAEAGLYRDALRMLQMRFVPAVRHAAAVPASGPARPAPAYSSPSQTRSHQWCPSCAPPPTPQGTQPAAAAPAGCRCTGKDLATCDEPPCQASRTGTHLAA